MGIASNASYVDQRKTQTAKLLTALALAFAMVFPTLLSWADFVALAKGGGGSNPAQQIAYGAGKVVQFAFPLLCVWFFERRLPRPAWPDKRGLALGLGFGLLVNAGMLLLYYLALRDTALFARTRVELQHKLEEFGAASSVGFILFGAFIILAHSLLEEYYYRWFLFGWLKRHLPLAAAIALSSLAFMAHHVIVLYVYMPGYFLTAVVPFSLGVAGGGVVWAWLYHRYGSLYAPWLSHAVVDAGLFVIGYDLFFVLGKP